MKAKALTNEEVKHIAQLDIQLKKELEFLYRVTASIHSLEIDQLLQEIVNIAIEVTGGDSCLIYVLDLKKSELVLRASKNPRRHLFKKIKMKIGEGITGWVAKKQTPVVISSGAYKDSRFKLFRSLPEDQFEAFLSVPIINKHGVCGVINIQNKSTHKYTHTEINLMIAIGKLVGGAVENALLIEESLALKEALELRKIIEKAKGILMKKSKLTEDQSYNALRGESMKTRKSLKDVAEKVILADKFHFDS